MSLRNASELLLIMIVGALVSGVSFGGRAVQAQAQSGNTAIDTYQRSADHFNFRAAGKSGAQRGEDLYYYKCWFCHNQYTKRAPLLKDIFKRPNITDKVVADRIREGGPDMPSYKTTLKDADIADLLSYLKEKCCFEGEDPPPNPRYIAGTKR